MTVLGRMGDYEMVVASLFNGLEEEVLGILMENVCIYFV